MNRVIESLGEWMARLEHEYPGVRFVETSNRLAGLNAVTAGVLVGRYHKQRTPAYGVVFDQPRSCGGRN
jgi:hypothetical protein